MSDGYFFARSRFSSLRLSLQYLINRERNGFSIHQEIEEYLQTLKSPCIADVGAGNGIWVMETAIKYANASFVALDISDHQYPAQHYWPENVKYDIWDFTQPLPAEFVQKFDFVNLSLVKFQIHDRYDVVLKNVAQMLKPGGYLQWVDGKYPFVNWYNETDQGIYKQIMDYYPFADLSWSRNTSQLLRNYGFTTKSAVLVPSRPHLAKYESEAVFLGFEELTQMIVSRFGADRETGDQLLKKIGQEIDEGARVETNLETIIARKS